MATKKAKERVFPKSAIPEGFRRVESGNFPPLHDFKKQAELIGECNAIKTIKTQKRGKVAETRIMYVADNDTGELVSVWESAALEGLFDEAQPGMQVWIKFTGLIKIKGRQMPMKGFESAVAGEPRATSKRSK